MNSLTLKENGFAEFVPIKAISFSSIPNDKSSVVDFSRLHPSRKTNF